MPAPREGLPYTLDQLYDFIDALEARINELEDRVDDLETAA